MAATAATIPPAAAGRPTLQYAKMFVGLVGVVMVAVTEVLVGVVMVAVAEVLVGVVMVAVAEMLMGVVMVAVATTLEAVVYSNTKS